MQLARDSSRAQATPAPSSGWRAGAQLVRRPEHGPLLRQHEACAVGGGGATKAVGGCRDRGPVVGRVELDRRDPQKSVSSRGRPFTPGRLTSQSTAASIGGAGDPSARSGCRHSRGTRPLKRWRYVALFCEEFMACAAIGARGTGAPELLGRSSCASTNSATADNSAPPATGRRGALELGSGTGCRMTRATGLGSTLALEERRRQARRSAPTAAAYVWTSRPAVRPRTARIAESRRRPACARVEALAIGRRHRRLPRASPSGAGGRPTRRGSADPREHCACLATSCRASTIRRAAASVRCGSPGQPREVGPVCVRGGTYRRSRGRTAAALRFAAEAQRSRRENLLLVAQGEYRAPFGERSVAPCRVGSR